LTAPHQGLESIPKKTPLLGRFYISIRCALNFFSPAAIFVERRPTGWLATLLTHHIVLLALATEADNRRVALRVSLGRVHQIAILRINFLTVRNQLTPERRPGLPIFRELTGRQEEPCSTIPQHIGIINLFAPKLRHRHGLHFGRRRLTTAQQLARSE